MRERHRLRLVSSFAVLAAAASLFVAPSIAAAIDHVPWVGSVRQAQQIAKARGQLVLLHFRGNNCPPCDRMDNEIFTQSTVVRAIASNYVPVKINVDDSPELKTHYKVTQWPTEIVLGPDGKEIRRWVGAAKSPDSYSAHLDGLAANFRVYQNGEQGAGPNGALDRGPSQYASDSRQSSDRQDRNAGPSGDQQNPYQQVQYTQQQYNQQQYSRDSASPREQPAESNPAPTYGYTRWRDTTPAPPTSRFAAPADASASASVDGASRSSQYVPRGTAGNESQASGAANEGNVAEAGYAGETNQPEPVQPRAQLNPYSRPDVRVAQAPTENYGSPQFRSGQFQPGRGADRRDTSNAPPANQYQPPAAHEAPAGDLNAASEQGAAAPYAATTPPNSPPPMAMDGFCPVTLCERQQWVKGDRRYGAIHRGRTYLFTTQAAQSKFLQNPDRFSPVLSGCDVVKFIDGGEFVDGLRKYGIFVGEHVFLFADEASLDAFEKNPRQYAQAAWQAMQDGGATLR